MGGLTINTLLAYNLKYGIMTPEVAEQSKMNFIEERFKELFKEKPLNIQYFESNKTWRCRIPKMYQDKYGLKSEVFGKDEKTVQEKIWAQIEKTDLQDTTLNELFQDWWIFRQEDIKMSKGCVYTGTKNFNAYKKYVLNTDLGKKRVADVITKDIKDLFRSYNDEITTASAKELKTVLNQLWDYAIDYGVAQVNVPRQVNLSDKTFRFIPKKPKPVKTPNERELLIEYYLSLDSVYGYALALLECLNIRVSELRALKWTDVYWKDKSLYINHFINDEGQFKETTKNNKVEGFRFIPLSDRAMSILETVKDKNYGFKDNFIFLGKDDNYLLSYYLNKNIKKACKACGIEKNFSTHDCRRYAATQASLSGMSMPAMQSAFGWADKDTSEKYINLAAVTEESKKILRNVLN